MNKKKIAGIVALAATCAALVGCAVVSPANNENSKSISDPITVITREAGSGTRGAFIELFGVEVKGADGTKTDRTTVEAPTQSSTNAMMTQVASDSNAIGYISLGSLNDTVKAVKINGADPTSDNIKSGAYTISRPFIIATKGNPSGLAKDFIDFIMSAEGQAVVEKAGYIKLDNVSAFNGTNPEGKIVVGGSSSVTPVMEKLKEAYILLNPAAAVDIQQSDSSAGMQGVMEGTYDIGMASREMKDEETAALQGTEIALDGIAVIINKENPINDLASATVCAIYTGEMANWSDVK